MQNWRTGAPVAKTDCGRRRGTLCSRTVPQKYLALLFFLALPALVFANFCAAQEKIVVQSTPSETPAGKPQDKTGASDSKKETAAATPDFSKEPIVYEQVRGKLRYEQNDTGNTEIHARIHLHI